MTTKNTARGTKLFSIADKPVYATAKGLKLGSTGKVQPAGEVLGLLPKGEARKLRKALRSTGHAEKAAAPRVTCR